MVEATVGIIVRAIKKIVAESEEKMIQTLITYFINI